MPRPRILILEDEGIVAMDIERRLRRLGYEVTARVGTAADALEAAEENTPDLALLDVVVPGGMDGIDLAERLRAKYDIPVIFLSAYSDRETLDRARDSLPHGFLVKPMVERTLLATIEMALRKHQEEKAVREREFWFDQGLKVVGDAVIVTDTKGAVRFMNEVAETLTGWSEADALDKDILEVFQTMERDFRVVAGGPPNLNGGSFNKAIWDCAFHSLGDSTTIIARGGADPIVIEERAAPIRDDGGKILAVALMFRRARRDPGEE